MSTSNVVPGNAALASDEALASNGVLPSADDVSFYRAHGWWLSPVIVPDELLDGAERAMSRFYAHDLDHHLRARDGSPYLPGWKPEDGDRVLRKNDYASLMLDQLAALVHNPLVAACAARLSGAAGLRLWHDQLLYKPVDAPGVAGNVGWHTDRQYWLNCTSDEMLTCWIPFHDVDEDTGTVTFVDGSHRFAEHEYDSWNQDLSALDAQMEAEGREPVLRPAPLRRGQASFHHCRTIHGSGPNRSEAPRRVLTVHLQPVENAYQDAFHGDGSVSHHQNDTLCRLGADGVPDYSDPAWFPSLWP